MIPHAFYKKIIAAVPIVCVDIYVYDERRSAFLLCQRTNRPALGRFCCPGGRVRKGEGIYQAAARKLREELGWRVPPSALWLIGLSDTRFRTSLYPGVGTQTVNISFFYSVKKNKTVKLNAEHARWQWRGGQEKDVVMFVRRMIKKIRFAKRRRILPKVIYCKTVSI